MSSDNSQQALQRDTDDVAIRVANLSKSYEIYTRPEDRLKQLILPRLQKTIGREPKKYHQEFWALKDISFEVKKGETLGIIGQNGAGKSTLLQIICGTLSPTSGEIEINGRIAALLELGSGFNPEFTGSENVYMNAAILGLTKEEVDKKYDEIVSFADIREFMNQPVKNYSSGMLMRLAFSVIAHVDADILVVDEALAVGDAFFTQKCMRFLRQFMKTGTLFFVSHDISSVISLCERAFWIEAGKLVLDSAPKDVAEKYLEAIFESTHGGESIREKSTAATPTPKKFDQRHDFINQSNLRNDIEIFAFNPEAESFGKGLAKITDVHISDNDGRQLVWCVGGEEVSIIINGKANSDLESIIVGFYIKDYRGQMLFGDNTFLTYYSDPFHLNKHESFFARFTFVMPRLPIGDYTISAAVATGTQDDHTQQYWIHDAVAFRSTMSSIASGLVGIPMQTIQLSKVSTTLA